MKKKFLLATASFILLGALWAGSCSAASLFSLTYNMGIPVYALDDYTSDASFRGFGFDYRYFLRDRLSVGGSFAWQGFDDMKSGTFTLEGVTVTGTQVRYANLFPFMANAHLYTGYDDSMVRFFGGVHAGMLIISQRWDIGVYSLYDDHVQFGFSPEGGFLVRLGMSSVGFMGDVRYNYGVKTQDYDSFSYWSFNVGLAFLS